MVNGLNDFNHNDDYLVSDDFNIEINDSPCDSMPNAIHFKKVVNQKDEIIKRFAEKYKTAIETNNELSGHINLMAQQIKSLKDQMHHLNTSINASKNEDESTIVLADFQCQTEWSDCSFASSIESARKFHHNDHESRIHAIGSSLNTTMEDKSEQTISENVSLAETLTQTDDTELHQHCLEQLESIKMEFVERENKTKLALIQQNQQINRDHESCMCEQKKLENQIDNLKSQISELENKLRRSKSEESEELDHHFLQACKRVNTTDSPSPLPPSSPLCFPVPNINDRASSLSPIIAGHVQK